jgi:hypothetical protein
LLSLKSFLKKEWDWPVSKKLFALSAAGPTEDNGTDMQAYRIHKMVIAADIAEEACDFYRQEIGGTPPDVIEELPYLMEVCCDDGIVKTIKERINEELDTRNAWLMMGIPCELHWPFVIGKCIE